MATATLPDADRPAADLDAMFAALADPTRRSIVAHLTEGEATVNELAEPFAMSLQAVSRHIQVLERAGLISRGRHRQTRPCRLELDAFRNATDWIEEQRRIWSERLDRLGEHLTDIQRDLPTQTGKNP
jgi:DNA-binding transcriptional ArsR family regulator